MAEATTFSYRDLRISLNLLSNCSISRFISQNGKFYEQDFLERISCFVSAGDTILDVGAHIGNHAVFFSKVLGARVIAFEPNPETFRTLVANVALNNVHDLVAVHNVAVGSSSGTGYLQPLHPGDIGTSSLINGVGGGTAAAIIRLDDMAEELFDSRISLVKLDVEGYEADVLEGGMEIFKKKRPIITAETSTLNGLSEIAKKLRPLGYFPVGVLNPTPTAFWAPQERLTLQESRYLDLISATVDYAVIAGERVNTISLQNKNLATAQNALEKRIQESERGFQTMQGQISKLEQTINILKQEHDVVRQQRDLLQRESGNITLAARIALQRKLVAVARRGQAYIGERPALKMWLLRALPPGVINRLVRTARESPTAREEVASQTSPHLTSPKLERTSDQIDLPQTHDLIVLCSAFPDGSGRYGGEFVRARVQGYMARGKSCLVIVSHSRYAKPELVRVDGVDILCSPHTLQAHILELIAKHPATSLFVHSPPPELTTALSRISGRKQTTIWFHGYEVRDYRRLAFNYSTEELELQRGFLDNVNRSRFEALRALDKCPEISTVFVSNYLLGVARGDSGAKLETAHVIPNFIDGNFFSSRVKSPDMARRILLIRSFSAMNYANDIAIGALRLLSERAEFGNLHITIRGTGRYFASLTASLTGFPNVDIKETYLSPEEIKALHDVHGLFLVPSRYDTQGVTMCEAMASGLVCVTNPVAAIPEFFDEACGYLARPESVEAFADAILTAIADGSRFTEKSRRAAERVRAQCRAEETIDRELALTKRAIRAS